MEKSAVPYGSLISAMFLVAGTCIGGGMLALPVATGISGFFPSLFMMLLCWIAMTATGLLLLEVGLWMEEGAHIITMTSRLLGKWGRAVSWVLYLFICYASLVAYTAGGGELILSALHSLTGLSFSRAIGCILFTVIFGMVVDFGARFVGRINSILFTAMILAYVGIVIMGIPEVKSSFLFRQRGTTSLLAIPLLLTSFSFQTMVPSLNAYLKRNSQALRLAIIGGTSIAFIIYAIWLWLVLGIVPVEGPHGLAVALQKGEPATAFLREAVQNSWVSTFAEYFAFFALVTSFLGIALGLFDFLADGLHLPKVGTGRLALGLLVAIPTLFCAIFFERAFLMGLELTGGYGDATLNGIIPILMVWKGRYHLQMLGNYRVRGGKVWLLFLMLFFLLSLGIEVLMNTGAIGFTSSFVDLELA